MVLRFALAAELERLGAHDACFIAENVPSGMTSSWSLRGAWGVAQAEATTGLAGENILEVGLMDG